MQQDNTPDFSFSYTTYSYHHNIDEEPQQTVPPPTKEQQNTPQITDTIPVNLFAHSASTMQALARYLIDVKGMTCTQAARLLGRHPKSLWTSYHQTPRLPTIQEDTIRIPIHIFCTTKAPLEALVSHLKKTGLRNIEIARLLQLDPKTTWTAAKRAEVKA